MIAIFFITLFALSHQVHSSEHHLDSRSISHTALTTFLLRPDTIPEATIVPIYPETEIRNLVQENYDCLELKTKVILCSIFSGSVTALYFILSNVKKS